MKIWILYIAFLTFIATVVVEAMTITSTTTEAPLTYPNGSLCDPGYHSGERHDSGEHDDDDDDDRRHGRHHIKKAVKCVLLIVVVLAVIGFVTVGVCCCCKKKNARVVKVKPNAASTVSVVCDETYPPPYYEKSAPYVEVGILTPDGEKQPLPEAPIDTGYYPPTTPPPSYRE